MLTTDEAIDTIKEDGYLFDIGQLSHATVLRLNAMTRRGDLVKSKALWPWITHGTCTKTIYSAKS